MNRKIWKDIIDQVASEFNLSAVVMLNMRNKAVQVVRARLVSVVVFQTVTGLSNYQISKITKVNAKVISNYNRRILQIYNDPKIDNEIYIKTLKIIDLCQQK